MHKSTQSGLRTCPNEIAVSFFENRISSANLYKSAAGSVPTERTKMRGVVGDESLKTDVKSAVCPNEKLKSVIMRDSETGN